MFNHTKLRTFAEAVPGATDGSLQLGENVVLQNETLAARIGYVIHSWAMLEAHLGWTAAKLFGTKADAGLAMIAQLKGGSLLDAVHAAAATELRGDDLLVFSALIRRGRALMNERDIVGHAVWAVTRHLPQHLLLIRGRHFQQYVGRLGKLGNTKKWPPSPKAKWPTLDLTQVYLYDEDAFLELAEDINRTANWFAIFHFPRFRKDSSPSAERQRLLHQPEIASLVREARAQTQERSRVSKRSRPSCRVPK